MDTAFQSLIDTVSGPLQEASLKSILQKFTSKCGFKYFAYVNVWGGEGSGISNYPMEWQHRYIESNFFLIDPVITNAKRGSYVYNWAVDTGSNGASKDVVNFYNHASEFSIRSGFSIAIPSGFGHLAILTLASEAGRAAPINPSNAHLAIAATAMIHMSLAKADNAISREIELTPREATCLRWLAEGKSGQEIAELLSISYSAVRFFTEGAKKKLNANTTMQAVALASRMRLI